MRFAAFRPAVYATAGILWAALAAAAPAGTAPDAPPPPSAKRIGTLVRQLGAPDAYDAREAAKRDLLAIGAPAEPALLRALDHKTPRIRRSACELLGRLKSEAAVPHLIRRLPDADADFREAAVNALEQIGDPARQAVTEARDAGTLPVPLANAVLDRPVQRAIEAHLDTCISKDLGWGFYKDQFKPIVALGPPATRVLLKLFTTPETDYVFIHTFDDETTEVRIRYRKQVLQRLAGEALVDMKDPSIVPALKAFLRSLGEVDFLDERDPRQDFYETTAFVLMRLGEPSAYRKLKDVFLKASGTRIGEDGALTVTLSGDLKACQKQLTALTRLAMLQIKADELPATERTYDKIIELARREQDEAALPVYDLDKNGTLDANERRTRDEAVDAILQRAFRGQVTPALERFWRAYAFYRGVLRGAYYNLACTLAQMDGRKDEAMDALIQAVRSGYEDAEWIKRDRDLDAIKNEPAYKRLIHDLERKRQREEERGG
jgi:HEAT repeat protein